MFGTRLRVHTAPSVRLYACEEDGYGQVCLGKYQTLCSHADACGCPSQARLLSGHPIGQLWDVNYFRAAFVQVWRKCTDLETGFRHSTNILCVL